MSRRFWNRAEVPWSLTAKTPFGRGRHACHVEAAPPATPFFCNPRPKDMRIPAQSAHACDPADRAFRETDRVTAFGLAVCWEASLSDGTPTVSAFQCAFVKGVHLSEF